MSVRSGMRPFELQKWAGTVDAVFGNPENIWEKVADVKVAINLQHAVVTLNDASYKVVTPTGLTDYFGFDEGEKYRLSGTNTYEVLSVYEGDRWASLLLKEVI